MKVIFNADDFGLTPGVNDGIIQSHLNGVVKSTTMLVGAPAEDHAIALAKQLPTLQVGLHLRFTLGRPLTRGETLCDTDGKFLSYQAFWALQDFDSAAVYSECVAQVEAFLKSGLTLSHIDSHHHAHTHKALLPIVQDVARQYGIPLRGQKVAHLNYTFSDQFYDQNVELDFLAEHLTELSRRNDVVEVMCHPANVDQALRSVSGYSQQREKELQVLTNPLLALNLAKRSIQVTDYSALSIQHE